MIGDSLQGFPTPYPENLTTCFAEGWWLAADRIKWSKVLKRLRNGHNVHMINYPLSETRRAKEGL